MKMNCKFFGLGAKVALCFVAVLGTMTSCYEKEDIKTVIDTTPKTVTYTISGSVYDYANLQGVSNANVVVTKVGAEAPLKTVVTSADGQFAISLPGLKDADRGDYSLTVTASGYKSRSTSISIYFEEAANQTIASHLDFALSALDMQGDEVKIVAGREDETIEIEGATAGEIDQIFIPKNVFGGGEPKTITLQRDGRSTEAASDAVRVYEGNPDGLEFVEPLVFSFEAPDNKQYKVFYEVNGIWTLADRDATVTFENGKYVAKIWHFSRFKFSEKDYDYNVVRSQGVPSTGSTYTADLAYYNGSNVDEQYKFVVNGLLSGAKYEKPLDDIFTGPAKEIAISFFETYLDLNDFYPALPGLEFNNKAINSEIKVPAHHNLLSATTTEEFETITYTMTFGGQTYTIKVKNVKQYNIIPVTEDYNHGGGIGHGHGHGDDLNAGGGIIDFE